MKVGILNFINATIVSIVSLIAIINSGAKFIFNLSYLGTRLARIFGKK